MYRKTLTAEHRDTLDAMCTLAEVYHDLERYDESVRLSQQEVELAEKALGPAHLETLAGKMNLAMAYSGAGQADEALRLEEEILPLVEKKLGRDHPRALGIRNNLAESYIEVGRVDEGCRMHEETLALLKEKLGSEHPNTLSSMSNLANAYSLAGRQDKAVQLLRRVRDLRKKVLPQHPATHWSALELLDSLASSGRKDDADAIVPLALSSLKLLAEVPGPMQREILDGLQWGSDAWAEEGKLDAAASLMETVLRIRRRVQDAEHADTLTAMILLGSIQVRRAKYSAAEPLLLQAYEAYVKRQAAGGTPEDKEQLQAAVTNLVQLYEKSGQPDKAKQWQEKLDALKNAAKSDGT